MLAGPRLAGHKRCFCHPGNPRVVWSIFRLLLTRANARLRRVTVTPFLLLHNHSECCIAKRGPLKQATCSDVRRWAEVLIINGSGGNALL